ncbi:Fur family transcriptional regulator [Marinifilum sp.]|uniref:Fur family transcriptional regulator n=1 Tax=Marinifilum sp. TaxID=2033137 RepID=UPI003BABCE1A
MTPAEILNTHKLKRTSCREGILEVVMNSGHALSENEIRESLTSNYDRTTFYRSFKTLEENNILHKIVVDNQLVKYALHHSITRKQEHAHFYCSICKMVKCLDNIPIQKYALPDGFSDNETEVIIKGTCPTCKNQNK